MASDRQQFSRAFEKWQELHEQGQYSVPRSIGSVAILCAYRSNLLKSEPTKQEIKDFKVFRKEAFALADAIVSNGVDVEVVLDPVASDIDDVVADPEIASIYTIGHGHLSNLFISGQNTQMYEWTDVSANADHLKTGVFVQRHCGVFYRSLNVPLGLFCMSDASKVFAPVGQHFNPSGLYHPDNQLLTSVFPAGSFGYKTIKEEFVYSD